jgi:hypothetical protein
MDKTILPKDQEIFPSCLGSAREKQETGQVEVTAHRPDSARLN